MNNYIGIVHSEHLDVWIDALNTPDADKAARWLELCRATNTVAMVTINMGDPERWIGEEPRD